MILDTQNKMFDELRCNHTYLIYNDLKCGIGLQRALSKATQGLLKALHKAFQALGGWAGDDQPGGGHLARGTPYTRACPSPRGPVHTRPLHKGGPRTLSIRYSMFFHRLYCWQLEKQLIPPFAVWLLQAGHAL